MPVSRSVAAWSRASVCSTARVVCVHVVTLPIGAEMSHPEGISVHIVGHRIPDPFAKFVKS